MAPPVRSDELTNVDVVTYALAQLRDESKPIHLERIAVMAFELAPGSFRWDLDEYMGLIDKDKVRVSLVDAARPAKGGLVQAVGVRRGGQSKRADLWRLTAAGAAWLRENEERLQAGVAGPTRRFKKGKADSLRNRLAASPLYGEFRETGSVSADPFAFTDLLECSPDAAESVVEQRLDALRAQVQMLEDENLLAFLDACEDAHTEILGRS
ncbi:MAG: hypothetical protein U0R52_11835 [Solirubrobacterales bacterium]